MFTSNGLMCLSGVSMCRIERLIALRGGLLEGDGGGGGDARDRGAPIAPAGDGEAEIGMRRGDAIDQPLRPRRRAREREARGAPGALADAGRAGVLQRGERRGDGRVREAAALGGREMVSDPALQLRDPGAEG